MIKSLEAYKMSVNDGQKQTPKQYKLVAPDGGWGYVIWISVTINLIALMSFAACFGMMYSDIFDQLNMGSTEATLLNGISALSVSISGFMTGPLLNCMSLRQLGTIGAIIYNMGSLGMAFAYSKVLFYICGMLQGLGNGIIYNISLSTINDYFVKKRRLSVTVTHTISVVAGIFAPLFVKWAAEIYGSRGCLVLVAAIYMHVFVAIALMQPVAWHMKKVELPPSDGSEMKPLLTYEDTNQNNTKVQTPEVKLPDDDYVLKDAVERKQSKDADKGFKICSLFKMLFRDFLDLSFLKSFLLSNASVGLSTCVVCEVTFLLMLPQALYNMGWTEATVAWVLSLNNIGDLVTKIIFVFFNSVIKFGSHEIYVFGLIIAFFSRLGMLWSSNETSMITFITIMGIARCIIILFIPLVVADSVSKEKFISAMGISMLIYGILSLILGPLIGAIRDLTNSYGTAFYIITSCYGIVIILWSIELLYKKNKHRRLQKKEAISA